MATARPTDVKTPPLRLVWEMAGNVALALFFLQFAAAHGRMLAVAFRLSSLLVMVKVAIDVWFYLVRRPPRDLSLSAYDWAIGFAGTFLVALFRPEAEGTDRLAAQTLQAVGIGMQIAGVLSLRRSFGIVAANRGIQTGGMYRFVRHPLYLSYAVAYGGYFLNQATPYNACIYAACLLLWVLRLLAEERLLLNDPRYREYAVRVRWRLVPFVF
jgi:protein-S-isoprenylcysteine O-methyltransferase Ste14